jgi:hypothetical protein
VHTFAKKTRSPTVTSRQTQKHAIFALLPFTDPLSPLEPPLPGCGSHCQRDERAPAVAGRVLSADADAECDMGARLTAVSDTRAAPEDEDEDEAVFDAGDTFVLLADANVCCCESRALTTLALAEPPELEPRRRAIEAGGGGGATADSASRRCCRC